MCYLLVELSEATTTTIVVIPGQGDFLELHLSHFGRDDWLISFGEGYILTTKEHNKMLAAKLKREKEDARELAIQEKMYEIAALFSKDPKRVISVFLC